MYCPNCHQKISDRARVCPWCGAALPAARRPGGGAGVFVALVLCCVLSVALPGQRRLPAALTGLGGGDVLVIDNPPRGSQEQRKEGDLGSAGYLRGDVLLVSLYIDDSGSRWDRDKQENVKSYLDVACDYLVEQAEDYGQTLSFYYDVDLYPDLMYGLTYDQCVAEDETGGFDRWLNKWIEKNVPIADLQEKYGTENIGFLALVADSGGAYTNVYYMEDPSIYYNESSVIFYYYPYVRLTDREVPAVYAHEILHQFGAIDLYEGSYDFAPENVSYVGRTYPDEIMYSDYTVDGRLVYEEIELSISPVTAYCLGWIDQLPPEDQTELKDFYRTCIAGFSEEDLTFPVGSGKHKKGAN